MSAFYLLLNSTSTALAITLLAGKTSGKACDGGTVCPPSKECCPTGCCQSSHRPSHPLYVPSSVIDLFVKHSSVFWCIFVLLLLFCMGGCGLWCRGKAIFRRRCCRDRDEERSERDSAGSCCAPPHYSACSTMRPPPPYAEVTSKPDLYPLVITYAGAGSSGKSGGNYLMVHYFRNFIVHPPMGTISAGSTVDSISSSLLCPSGTDTDCNVPPPYEEPEQRRPIPPSLSGLSVATATVESLDTNVTPRVQRNSLNLDVEPEEILAVATHQRPSNMRLTTFSRPNRTVTTFPENRKHYPPEVILQQPQRYCDLHYLSTDLLTGRQESISSEDFSQPRGSLQDFVSSDGLSRSGRQFSTSSDVSSLVGLNTPDSPPRATSPTGELKDLLDKIHQLPRTRLSQYSETDAQEEEDSLLQEEPSRPSVLPIRRRPVKSKTFHLPFIQRSRSRPVKSLSAPTTPLSALPTTSLFANAIRSSSKKSMEDSNPLLADEEVAPSDHDEVF